MGSTSARWLLAALVSCLAAAALGAPVNESVANATDASEFDAAIAEMRAKREALRRTRFDDDGAEDAASEEDGAERDDPVAALLAGVDDPAELSSLAKEIALDVLAEESARRRPSAERRSLKKKKQSAAAAWHLDDERRKRANALFYRLMDDADGEPDDVFDEQTLPAEDNDDEDDVVSALANQGRLDRREIEAIMSQLLEQEADDVQKKKKKRSGERWKMPRAAPRRRRLPAEKDDAEDDDDDDGDDDDADGPDERIGFFGRGFRPGAADETGDGKRVALRPLKFRTARDGGVVKRSVADLTKSRQKRSAETASPVQNETATPPLALPLKVPTTADVDERRVIVRKKSVDWDDYFGFDKRKRAPPTRRDEANDEAVRDYLENEYYKSIAGSLAYRKKRASFGAHGTMKRSNATTAALAARKLNRLRAQMVARLVDDLEPGDIDEAADRLSRDLVRALEDDAEANDADAIALMRRSSLHAKKSNGRKRLDDGDDDEDDKRRKRLPAKRRAPKRTESDADDDDECAITEQVVATCNLVSHLYGGYRPVLSDACIRHQACSVCSENDEACDVEYQRRVLALCGPDLLCQSQSRHLLAALNQLDEMEAGFLHASQRKIQTLCRRDACLADLFKRR